MECAAPSRPQGALRHPRGAARPLRRTQRRRRRLHRRGEKRGRVVPGGVFQRRFRPSSDALRAHSAAALHLARRRDRRFRPLPDRLRRKGGRGGGADGGTALHAGDSRRNRREGGARSGGDAPRRSRHLQAGFGGERRRAPDALRGVLSHTGDGGAGQCDPPGGETGARGRHHDGAGAGKLRRGGWNRFARAREDRDLPLSAA